MHPTRHHRSPLALILILLAVSTPAMAQGDSLELGVDIPHWLDAPQMWVALGDSDMFYRVVSDSLLPALSISEGFQYQMFDSACMVYYLFTELRNNQSRVPLRTWIKGRVANGRGDLLSSASASDTFRVSVGDTISFYRQVTWMDTLMDMDTANYKAVDTLGWAVELVKIGDTVRAATLDSISILPSSTPSRPTICTTRPLYAVVTYVVPAFLDNQPVFVRQRLYHRGSGLRHFTRNDLPTFDASRSARDTNFSPWFILTGHVVPKVTVQRLASLSDQAIAAAISVSTVGRMSTFESTVPCSDCRFAVYGSSGQLDGLAWPAERPGTNPKSTYTFAAAGVYFVVLFDGASVVACQQINIVQ